MEQCLEVVEQLALCESLLALTGVHLVLARLDEGLPHLDHDVHFPEIGRQFFGDPADQARGGDEVFRARSRRGEAMTLAQMLELLEEDTG